jgi:hypothetical protein
MGKIFRREKEKAQLLLYRLGRRERRDPTAIVVKDP